MSWMARLKSEKPPEPTLGNLGNPNKVGFLGSLASIPGGVLKNEGGFLGSLAPTSGVVEKFKGTTTTPEPGPLGTRQVAANDPTDPLPPLAAVPQADHHGTPDPDRWCWPHGTAMNTGEIDSMAARLARFTDKGLSLDDAERLADKLVMRDRDGDSRHEQRLCLECAHLQGVGRWGCGNWQRAEVTRHGLAPELVTMLQRCGGFRAAVA